MSTVVRRTFQSTPAREASQTWAAIVELLVRHSDSAVRSELEAVTGVASSLIADQAPKDAAITVVCDGPRTRIYCLYDDDAIAGDDVNEDALSFDPLKGDWSISLPCLADDLDWTQRALAQHSKRITARDLSEAVESGAKNAASSKGLVLDTKGFFGS